MLHVRVRLFLLLFGDKNISECDTHSRRPRISELFAWAELRIAIHSNNNNNNKNNSNNAE